MPWELMSHLLCCQVICNHYLFDLFTTCWRDNRKRYKSLYPLKSLNTLRSRFQSFVLIAPKKSWIDNYKVLRNPLLVGTNVSTRLRKIWAQCLPELRLSSPTLHWSTTTQISIFKPNSHLQMVSNFSLADILYSKQWVQDQHVNFS